MTTTAQCPHCYEMNAVAPSTIGRYVNCKKCHCKFWVYVTPLGEGAAQGSLVEQPSAASPTAASRGHGYRPDSPGAIRQESLLATIHDDLVFLRRQITMACLIFLVGCAAVIAILLFR